MKTIVAVLVLALLALADARTILNKSVAKATSVAVADEGSYASSDSHAHASDGSLAVSDAAAIALEESKAFATADADADDGSTAKADALALASKWSLATADADADAYYWSDASAEANAVATNDGYAESTADADAVYEAKADASSTASADGGEAKAVSKADANNGKATSVAKAESEETHHYYPGCYDDACDDDDNDEGKDYYHPSYYYGYKDPKAGGAEAEHYYPYYFDPYYYKYAHYTYSYPYYQDPAVEGGNEATVKYYGYYIPHPKVEEEEEVTTVKLIDPAIIEYYSHKVYDFGCYEGKFYRCTYDDSCGTCPYGHFCGTVKKNVCKAVTVWVKKCDAPTPEPVKKCRPVLTPCGKGFCKYNEKCATDYSWCGGKWCEPKYTCIAVAQPKKCVWVIISDEYGFEKKVEKCEDYKVEACAAGTAPCPIGYECSADPCTFVETTVKKCEDEDVPVCLPYDLPTYGDLYSACGPAYCHPGYKCESFEHKTCAPKLIAVDPKVVPVYHPIVGGAGVGGDGDCDDCHHFIPYGVSKSSAQATATAVGFKKVDPIVEAKKVDPKVMHVYHPIVGGAGDHDDDGCDDDDCHHFIPDLPFVDGAGDHDDDDCDDDCNYLIPYGVHKSNAEATANSVSTSHATSEESYTNVVLSASGSGSASGSADASTDNTSAWSKGQANKDVEAKIWTGSKASDNGKAVATGEATYENGDD